MQQSDTFVQQREQCGRLFQEAGQGICAGYAKFDSVGHDHHNSLLYFVSVFSGRQQELHYRNGKMYLNYTSGAKCENGTGNNANYQLIVQLTCDYTIDVSPLHVTPYVRILIYL